MILARRRFELGLLSLPLFLMSCRSSEVASTPPQPMVRMPPPDRVLVAPFTMLVRDGRTVAAGQVAPPPVRPVDMTPQNSPEAQAARSAQSALQTALVQALRAHGLPAEPGRADAARSSAMLVQGQLIAADEGARGRRGLFGGAANRGSMTSDVQLLYVMGRGAPQYLESFDATAGAGRQQDMMLPTGAGAVAVQAPAASGSGMAGSVAGQQWVHPDVLAMAENVAQRVASYSAGQGWIRR